MFDDNSSAVPYTPPPFHWNSLERADYGTYAACLNNLKTSTPNTCKLSYPYYWFIIWDCYSLLFVMRYTLFDFRASDSVNKVPTSSSGGALNTISTTTTIIFLVEQTIVSVHLHNGNISSKVAKSFHIKSNSCSQTVTQ